MLPERIMFLPPYSPDFNPIEKGFACLQAMLRKAIGQTVARNMSVLSKLVDLSQPQEHTKYSAPTNILGMIKEAGEANIWLLRTTV